MRIDCKIVVVCWWKIVNKNYSNQISKYKKCTNIWIYKSENQFKRKKNLKSHKTLFWIKLITIKWEPIWYPGDENLKKL